MNVTGWRTRGYLPHRDESRLIQHIVLNLADALPHSYAGPYEPGAHRRWVEAELDRGHGARSLETPENATLVETCLLHDHGQRYALAAWCVMPNHVHIVAEQFDGHGLSDIVQTWKSVSAHAINKRLNRKGPLWQREYFDRFIRNEEHFLSTVAYVENNPVAAKLAAHACDWRFSSAWSGRLNENAGEGAGAPGWR